MTGEHDPSRSDIQVVARSAQVLDLFGYDRRTVRIADVAERLQVGRTTAHRYLVSLSASGLLERGADGSYGLGPVLIQLGALALNQLGVVDLAEPYLRDLADTASETSVLTVWGGRSPVVVRSYQPEHRVLNVSISVGRVLNVDAAQSAVFMAYRADDGGAAQVLAQLGEPYSSRVRARVQHARTAGIAISETVNQGTRAIAAPVFGREGALAAAVAIIGTVHTLPADLDSGKISALRDTAERLSEALGHRASSTRRSQDTREAVRPSRG